MLRIYTRVWKLRNLAYLSYLMFIPAFSTFLESSIFVVYSLLSSYEDTDDADVSFLTFIC
jgi:hypothetical protein